MVLEVLRCLDKKFSGAVDVLACILENRPMPQFHPVSKRLIVCVVGICRWNVYIVRAI